MVMTIRKRLERIKGFSLFQFPAWIMRSLAAALVFVAIRVLVLAALIR